MNIEPGYEPYDPYAPHTPAEILEWEENQKRLSKEREQFILKCNLANISIEYHKDLVHKLGENINAPLKTYKVKVWRDRDTNEVLKQEILETYNSDIDVPKDITLKNKIKKIFGLNNI